MNTRLNYISNSGDPVMMDLLAKYPNEMAQMASSPITDFEFENLALQYAGQGHTDQLILGLNEMDNFYQISTWNTLSPARKAQALNAGYSPPASVDGGGGGGGLMGFAGDVLGGGLQVAARLTGAPGRHLAGGVLRGLEGMGWFYDKYINHGWRVAERLDELGGGQWFNVPHLIAHPMDLKKAWDDTWDGERYITDDAKAKGRDIIERESLTSSFSSVFDLAVEMQAGVGDAEILMNLGFDPQMKSDEFGSAWTELQILKTQDGFKELRNTIENGKASMGRYIANDYFGMDTTEGWGKLVSGTGDLIWNIKMDPLAGLGRMAQLRKAKMTDLTLQAGDVDGAMIRMLDLAEAERKAANGLDYVDHAAIGVAMEMRGTSSFPGKFFKGGALSMENALDKFYAVERRARKMNQRQAVKVNNKLEVSLKRINDYLDGKPGARDALSRDYQTRNWRVMMDDLKSWKEINGLDTVDDLSDFMRNPVHLNKIITGSGLTGYQAGMILMPTRGRLQGGFAATSNKVQDLFGKSVTVNSRTWKRQVGEINPDDPSWIHTTGEDLGARADAWETETPAWLDMSPENRVATDPMPNGEMAYNVETGRAGNPFHWKKLANLSSKSKYLTRQMRKAGQLAPESGGGLFRYDEGGAVAEFDKYLEFSKVMGIHDDLTIDAIGMKFATSSPEQRRRIAELYVSELVASAGIEHMELKVGGITKTWGEKFVDRSSEIYGLNGMEQALYVGQGSAAMMMPNWVDFYRAVNSVHAGVARSGMQKLHYGVIDPVMSTIWAPMQLLRPGFVIRNGGEELMQILLDPGRGIENTLKSRYLSKWALEKNPTRRVSGFNGDLLSMTYETTNTIPVRIGDEIAPYRVPITRKHYKQAKRDGLVRLETPEGEHVLDALDFYAEIDKGGRELLAARPVTFFTNWFRSTSGTAGLQIDDKMLEEIILNEDIARQLGREGKFGTEEALFQWVNQNPKNQQLFEQAFKDVRQNWLNGQSRKARSIMYLDEISRYYGRAWGKKWNKYTNGSTGTSKRNKIGKIFISDEEEAVWREALEMTYAVPASMDARARLHGGNISAPYVSNRPPTPGDMPGRSLMISTQSGESRSIPMRSRGSEMQWIYRDDMADFQLAMAYHLMQIWDDPGAKRAASAYMHARLFSNAPGVEASHTYKGVMNLVRPPAGVAVEPLQYGDQLIVDQAKARVGTKPGAGTTVSDNLHWHDHTLESFGDRLDERNAEIRTLIKYEDEAKWGFDPINDKALIDAHDTGDTEIIGQYVDANPTKVLTDILAEADADLDDALQQVFGGFVVRYKDYLKNNLTPAPLIDAVDEWQEGLKLIDKRFGTKYTAEFGDMAFLYRNVAERSDEIPWRIQVLLDPTFRSRPKYLPTDLVDNFNGSTMEEYINQVVSEAAAKGQIQWPHTVDKRAVLNRLYELTGKGEIEVPPIGAVSGYVVNLDSTNSRNALLQIIEDPYKRDMWNRESFELVTRNGRAWAIDTPITPEEAGQFTIEVLLGQTFDPGPKLVNKFKNQFGLGADGYNVLTDVWQSAKISSRGGDESVNIGQMLDDIFRPTTTISPKQYAWLKKEFVQEFEVYRWSPMDYGSDTMATRQVEREGTRWVTAAPFAHLNRDEAIEMHDWLYDILKKNGLSEQPPSYPRIGRVDMPNEGYHKTEMSEQILAGKIPDRPAGEATTRYTDRELLEMDRPVHIKNWKKHGEVLSGGYPVAPHRLKNVKPADGDAVHLVRFEDQKGRSRWLEAKMDLDTGKWLPDDEARRFHPEINEGDELTATYQEIWDQTGYSEQTGAKILGAQQADDVGGYVTTRGVETEPDEVAFELLWAMENDSLDPEWIMDKGIKSQMPHRAYGPPALVAPEVDTRQAFVRHAANVRDVGFSEILTPAIDWMVRTPHFTLQLAGSIDPSRHIYRQLANTAKFDLATRRLNDEETAIFRENSRHLIPRLDEVEKTQAVRGNAVDTVTQFFSGLRKGDLNLAALDDWAPGVGTQTYNTIVKDVISKKQYVTDTWKKVKAPENLDDQIAGMVAQRTGLTSDVEITLTTAQKRDISKEISSRIDETRNNYWHAARNESMAYTAQASAATEIALRKMTPFIDDHRMRSLMDWQLKAFLPFFFAEQQFLKRTGRMLIHHPEALIRAHRLINGIRSMGMLGQDEYGNTMLTIPGTAEVFNGVVDVAELAFGDKLAIPNVDDVSFNVEYLLPGVSSSVGQPQWGPAVSFPIAFLADRYPMFAKIEAEMAGGAGSVMIPNEKMDYLRPAWSAKILNAFFQDPQEVGSAWFQSANIQQMNPDTYVDQNSSALEKEKWLSRNYDYSQVIGVSRGLFSFMGGSTPSFQNTEYVELRKELQELLDVGVGFEDAMQMFLELHPESTVMTVFGTKSTSGAPVQATSQTYEWYMENEELVNKFPYAGTWMLPTETNVDISDEYTQRAHREFLTSELRVRRTADEVMEQMFFANAANKYFPLAENTERRIAAHEANGNQAMADQMSDEWDNYKKQFMRTHPVFEEVFALGRGKDRRERTISELRTMLRIPDSSMGGASNSWTEIRPIAQILIDYDDAILAMTGVTGQKGTERREMLRIQAYEAAAKYARLHPRAMVFFNSVVRWHVGGLKTEILALGPGVSV